MDELISRQAAIKIIKNYCENGCDIAEDNWCPSCQREQFIKLLEALPSAQFEIVECKDCKYFELDHFEKAEEFPVPIIVAHEICMKWSDGCQTSKDGWCFMGEKRTDGN